MFCTSLRRRASCHAIVPILHATSGLSLSESQLGTHDIQLPLRQEAPKSPRLPETPRLDILLLSPSSLQPGERLQATQIRIQRFANNGANLAIVLQLSTPSTPSVTPSFTTAKQLAQASGTHAYSQLQIMLISDPALPHIPTLLISKPDGIAEVLRTHVAHLNGGRMLARTSTTTTAAAAATAFDILKLCTLAPPMREETAFYISDLFTGLADLASACSGFHADTSVSLDGKRGRENGRRGFEMLTAGVEKLARLENLVGEREVRNIIGFWRDV